MTYKKIIILIVFAFLIFNTIMLGIRHKGLVDVYKKEHAEHLEFKSVIRSYLFNRATFNDAFARDNLGVLSKDNYPYFVLYLSKSSCDNCFDIILENFISNFGVGNISNILLFVDAKDFSVVRSAIANNNIELDIIPFTPEEVSYIPQLNVGFLVDELNMIHDIAYFSSESKEQINQYMKFIKHKLILYYKFNQTTLL